MKTRFSMLHLLAIASLVLTSIAFMGCGDTEKKPAADTKMAKGANNEQIICPITKHPINKQFFADKDGKRIYGCDQRCVEVLTKGFDNFEKQMEADGITLAKAQ
ncbi:TPA: hypothetical protein DDW35_05695 [Candidatus Sumerlaeota bacterium]|jgi:hypothetical protein|nr:hypothetical protein [Candidatus Sumerlaeota bacterium]